MNKTASQIADSVLEKCSTTALGIPGTSGKLINPSLDNFMGKGISPSTLKSLGCLAALAGVGYMGYRALRGKPDYENMGGPGYQEWRPRMRAEGQLP